MLTEENAPFVKATYLDFRNHKQQNALIINSPDKHEVWYSEIEIPQLTLKVSQKTKNIQGYTCYKATVKHLGNSYTLWIASGIEATFCPIPALAPAQGVVLAIETATQSFVATQVTLEPVSPAAVLMPGGGEKISPDVLKEKETAASLLLAVPAPK